MVDRLAALIGSVRDEVMAPQGLSVWSRAQRTLQPVEAWQTFRPWVERDNPRMAFNVARGLVAGSTIGEAERGWAELMRQEARGRMAYLLPPGTILCLPTTPFPGAEEGSAAAGARPAARPHLLPLLAWRPDRGAAGQPARRRRSTVCRSGCRSSAPAAATRRWSRWRGR